MTLREAPAILTVPCPSSSGTATPGFTDLRTSRFRGSWEEAGWVEVEDLLRLDAYLLATLSSPSTSVGSFPDWGRVLLAGAERGPEGLSPAEQLKTISKILSLSKVELARVLGVSRQTIYDWLEGRPVSPENEDRLLRLARLAWDFGGKDGKSLLRRFTTQSVHEGEPSILEMLLTDPWDEKRLRRALGEAQARTTRRKSESARAWLRSFGFPEPKPSEKTANLGHNLLLDDLERS